MKKKFFSFILAFAVILVGAMSLTACGGNEDDKRGTFSAINMPAHIASCHLQSSSSTYTSGNRIENGRYKIELSIENGYSKGNLLVYVNGEQKNLIPYSETASNLDFYTEEFDVSGDVKVTFTGAPVEVRRDVTFTCTESTELLDNMYIQFEEAYAVNAETNVSTEPMLLSEFLSGNSTFENVPVAQKINFNIYYSIGGENGTANNYSQGLMLDVRQVSKLDPDPINNAISCSSKAVYDEGTNSLVYKVEFRNSIYENVYVNFKFEKKTEIGLSIYDGNSTSVNLPNSLFAVSTLAVDGFDGDGNAEISFTFDNNKITNDQLVSIKNALVFGIGNSYDFISAESVDVVENRIVVKVRRPVTYEGNSKPYDLQIVTNLITKLSDLSPKVMNAVYCNSDETIECSVKKDGGNSPELQLKYDRNSNYTNEIAYAAGQDGLVYYFAAGEQVCYVIRSLEQLSISSISVTHAGGVETIASENIDENIFGEEGSYQEYLYLFKVSGEIAIQEINIVTNAG